MVVIKLKREKTVLTSSPINHAKNKQDKILNELEKRHCNVMESEAKRQRTYF